MTRSSKLIAWALALGLAGLSLPATDLAAGPHRTPPARCPTRIVPRGTVTFSDWQFPDTLNPYQTTQLVTREVTNALFESLVQYDSRAHLIPQLARSVPTVRNGGIGDGGRTVVVRLKAGLRWSDGAPITARDIWFGWKIGMDPATGPACLGTCDVIQRIDARGTDTAVLHLKHPFAAAVPAALPDVWPHRWPGAWSNNPHAAALKLGGDSSFNFESSRFPTDGPYQVAAFHPHDRITLRPMRFYAGMTCGASLSSLVFTAYPSKADLVAAAAAHRTDLTTGYESSDLTELRRHGSAFHVAVHTSFAFEHLELNVDSAYGRRRNPLADRRVRLALALALDKGAVVANVQGTSGPLRPASSLWVDAPDLHQPYVSAHLTGQWDPIARSYVRSGSPQALKDARSLLRQASYGHGFTLALYTTSGSPARQGEEAALAASWSGLGIRVKPNYVSPSRLLGSWASGGVLARGRFQAALFAYLGAPDPDGYKYNLESGYCDRRARFHSSINGNYGCVRDSIIDAAFLRGARSLSPAARMSAYDTVAQEVNQQAYWIPLYFRPSIATDDGRIANASLNPTDLGPTWNVYAWRLRTP